MRSLLSMHVFSNFNMAAKNNPYELRLESPKGAKSLFLAHFGFQIDESGKRVDKKVCVVDYVTTRWAFLEIQLTLMLIKCGQSFLIKLHFQ